VSYLRVVWRTDAVHEARDLSAQVRDADELLQQVLGHHKPAHARCCLHTHNSSEAGVQEMRVNAGVSAGAPARTGQGAVLIRCRPALAKPRQRTLAYRVCCFIPVTLLAVPAHTGLKQAPWIELSCEPPLRRVFPLERAVCFFTGRGAYAHV